MTGPTTLPGSVLMSSWVLLKACQGGDGGNGMAVGDVGYRDTHLT